MSRYAIRHPDPTKGYNFLGHRFELFSSRTEVLKEIKRRLAYLAQMEPEDGWGHKLLVEEWTCTRVTEEIHVTPLVYTEKKV